MNLNYLERAVASTRTVPRRCDDGRLDKPTALPGWSVRRLITHVVGATSFFADTETRGACRDDRAWPRLWIG